MTTYYKRQIEKEIKPSIKPSKLPDTHQYQVAGKVQQTSISAVEWKTKPPSWHIMLNYVACLHNNARANNDG